MKELTKPNINASRLPLGMYSYINNISSPWIQHPKSFTRFLCWSLAIQITSFLNSSNPCMEVLDSRFTAISRPSRTPWRSPFDWDMYDTLIFVYFKSSNFVSFPSHLFNQFYTNIMELKTPNDWLPYKLVQIHPLRAYCEVKSY